MALSDFQTKKLMHLYQTFFDNDHNGTIEKADFDMVADKVTKMRGWAAGSPQATRMRQRLEEIWSFLQKADVDGDGVISEKEWLQLWTDVIVNSKNVEWTKLYQDLVFDAQDVSGDGTVDEQEFVSLYACLGLPKDKCSEAFKKLTAGGPPTLTKDTFVQRFQEFIVGCFSAGQLSIWLWTILINIFASSCLPGIK